ncbi:MAG: hypothetical protein O3A82_02205 [Verrucomicrobia bacterium]|nr:hypothetical protein [Verrucomicrobiota bacterium]MDA0723074.1 hypothetical protein [Verrucomicrobiota bacterium]MDA1045722.1 hypothetical protein [Verrucomicrobiota bacterium]
MTTKTIPSELSEIWRSIKDEVMWTHGRWILYRQLFGTDEHRVSILNRSASTAFSMIQGMMLNDIQLSISRLGDPAGSGARKNLTLRRLLVEVRKVNEATLASELEPLIDIFESHTENVRTRRNKAIAHLDLATKLETSVVSCAGPSREEIETALESLRGVLNHIELYFTDSQTLYNDCILRAAGDSLISSLTRGLRYSELVKARDIPHDDLRINFKK